MIIKGGVETEEKGNGEAQNKMPHFQINYVDFFLLVTEERGRQEVGGRAMVSVKLTVKLWAKKSLFVQMTKNSQKQNQNNQ